MPVYLMLLQIKPVLPKVIIIRLLSIFRIIGAVLFPAYFSCLLIAVPDTSVMSISNIHVFVFFCSLCVGE